MSYTNDRELSFDERYREAIFVVAFPNHVDLEVRLPSGQSHRVRVQKHEWREPSPDWETFKPGMSVGQVFIYNFNPQGHSFGNLRWGNRGQNPWEPKHPDHPNPGDCLPAKVIQPAGDQTVVLTLETTGQEAFLHKSQVPGGLLAKTALEQLPLGCRLWVCLKRVDAQRCNMEASVLDGLARLRLEDERQCVDGIVRPSVVQGQLVVHEDTPYMMSIDAGLLANPNPAIVDRSSDTLSIVPRSLGVLVIDDDPDFLRDLTHGLRALGLAHVWGAKDANEAKQRFEQAAKPGEANITHVIADYHLGSFDKRKAVLHELLRHERQLTSVAVMSGMADQDVQAFAAEIKRRKGGPALANLQVLRKPLTAETLMSWLQGQALPEIAIKEPTPETETWGMGRSIQVHERSRTEEWLNRACSHFQARAALWVKALQPGYELIGSVGLPPTERLTSTLSMLGQSRVVDAESTGQALRVGAAEAGVLRTIWPQQVQEALILPIHSGESEGAGSVAALSEPGESAPAIADIVIFFVTGKIGLEHWSADNPTWLLLRQWWQDLCSRRDFSEQLLDQESFATLGRAWAASLHEIRPLLQPFANKQAWTPEASKAWWPNGTRLLNMVQGGLYRVRTLRSQRIHMRAQVQRIFDEVLWTFAQRHSVAVWLHLPAPDLVAQLPPEVLEHPLINLFENALKSCVRMRAQRKHAWVEVGVDVDTRNPKLPLVVWVRDQGDGMTPAQQRRLFNPRHSVDHDGTGLGLFLSRRMVQACGGDLRLVETTRWRGSRFELRLPLNWADDVH